MSLLNSGTEDVVLYPQVRTTDVDGNPVLRPAETGVPARARVQPLTAEELADRGFGTQEVYRLRLARSSDIDLGTGGEVEWQGSRWTVFGPPEVHRGSPATARRTYRIRRA